MRRRAPSRAASAILAALCAVGAPSVLAAQETSPVLVDRHLTVGAGAAIAAAVGETIARVEDAYVPHRLFSEDGRARRTANVAYRIGKFVAFDVPQEQWLVVVNHEIFGHGGRLREQFDGRITYRIHAPVPYGRGGGSTSFEFDRRPTVHELLSIAVGGMEADAVAARVTTRRAFSAGRLRPRDALRYLGFELDTFGYVLHTSGTGEDPENDVSNFLRLYNDIAVAVAAPGLTLQTLRREVFVSLANPMVGYAAYGIARYLWSGTSDVRIPALSIAGVRYLPLMRYQLTPYGTEWSVMNHLAGRVRPTEIEMRFGRSPGATPWGIGVTHGDLTLKSWRIGLSIDVWRQPPLRGPSLDVGTVATRAGGAVKGRFQRPLVPLWFGSTPATAIVDVGVKSAGYVPGEQLRGGITLRAGVGLPLAR